MIPHWLLWDNVTTFTHPTVFLTGAVQRNIMEEGDIQRNANLKGNVQRNVELTSDAGSNSLF